MLFVNQVQPNFTSKRGLSRLAAALLALSCAVSYCAAQNPPVRSSQPVPPASSAPQPDSVNVLFRLHGSNTIGAELAPALAEAFLRQRGAANIHYQPSGEAEKGMEIGTLPGQTAPIAIEIQAKGSATGVADLARGSADIGMLSRKIKSDEKAKLSALGDLEAYGSENVLGLDGVAIIVHTSNPVSKLTVEQVRKIFSGEIKDWQEVGGAAGGIQVYSRPQSTSGTYETFDNLVLKPAKLIGSAKQIEDSGQLSDTVAQDPGGIGFIGLPYIRSAKAVAIGDAGTKPLMPTPFTVGREDYRLSRRLFLYLPPASKNLDARKFVTFSLSQAGQAVVEKVGFVSQSIKVDVTRKGVNGTNALNFAFRFRVGSSQLDNKSLDDMNRIVEYIKSLNENPPILLIGHADNTGSEEINQKLSKERANVVAEELKSRGLNVTGTGGQGSKFPVASNDTPDGRQQNRRVEVWTRM